MVDVFAYSTIDLRLASPIFSIFSSIAQLELYFRTQKDNPNKGGQDMTRRAWGSSRS